MGERREIITEGLPCGVSITLYVDDWNWRKQEFVLVIGGTVVARGDELSDWKITSYVTANVAFVDKIMSDFRRYRKEERERISAAFHADNKAREYDAACAANEAVARFLEGEK